MDIPIFLSTYILWHYSVALADFFRIWSNFFWFNWHFFSVPLLTRTLFVPWKRLSETKKTSGLRPDEFLGNLAVNVSMRLVGLFARLFLLAVGAVFFIATAVLGVILLVVWVSMPLLIPLLCVFGTRLIFS